MGLREIKQQLGLPASLKARQVINHLIRDLVGGEDCLAAMELSLRLATRLKERGYRFRTAS